MSITILPSLTAESGAVDAALARLAAERVVERIWARDHRVWAPEPTEIADRLGWLDAPETMAAALPRLRALADEIRAAGFRRILLLGMGGSSLAPEVLARSLGAAPGFPSLRILDSTHPEAVRDALDHAAREPTLFVVATKSGGTVETLSFCHSFFTQRAERVGPERAGEAFLAITDPGSGLAALAQRLGFRHTLLNDPEVGGRFSALTFFGLAPAALIGADLDRILASAAAARAACRREDPRDNPGALLGAILGALALRGRDKLALATDPALPGLDDWVEQLVAESSGKAGRGILPLVGTSPATLHAGAPDRLLVHTVIEAADERDAAGAAAGPEPLDTLDALVAAGQPMVRVRAGEVHDLGGLFFVWQMATAVAGAVLGINPFDQPDVEAAKVQARRFVAAYRSQGRLPEPEPIAELGEIRVYGELSAELLADATRAGAGPTAACAALLATFARATVPRGYVGLQAYLPPGEAMDRALALLREALGRHCGRAVTLGYGPRFLHSTGQLHKGDARLGRFVQITAEPRVEVPIPDALGDSGAALSYGVLIRAQALGDAEALRAAGRPLLRLHVAGAPEEAIRALAETLVETLG